VSGLHKGARQHLWQGGACLRCGMRTHWEGAKDGCSGVLLEEEARNRQRRYEERRRAADPNHVSAARVMHNGLGEKRNPRGAGTPGGQTGTEGTSR
jgi:hypothetical protein